MSTPQPTVVLEKAAQEFADATAQPPLIYQLSPDKAREVLEDVQRSPIEKPDADIEDITVSGGPHGQIAVRLIKPAGATGPLPVILYVHGAGWVLGSPQTHDLLVRNLAAGAQAAAVFPDYQRAPEAQYPSQIEEAYATAEWIAEHGSEHGLDPSRLAIAGDSVGGNMAIAVALMAKQRGGPAFAAQLLYYPVTDAGMDTGSYHQFAEGYFLAAAGMEWFWDQYLPDKSRRSEILASPLRASAERTLRPAARHGHQRRGRRAARRRRGLRRQAPRRRGPGHRRPLWRHHPRLRDAAPAGRHPRRPRRHRPGRRLPAPGPARRLTQREPHPVLEVSNNERSVQHFPVNRRPGGRASRAGQRFGTCPGRLHPRPVAAAVQLGPVGSMFAEAGYAPVSPGWPDDPDTVAEANADPEVFANKTIGAVADHYSQVIGTLTR